MKEDESKNKLKALTLVLIAANLVMLVLAILTIPPNFRGKAEKSPEPVLESAAQETQEPTQQEEPQQEETAVPTANTALSTAERPSLEDFLWYSEGVRYEGIPAEAASIDSVEAVSGGWKALIIYDPDNAYDSGATEFLNMTLDGGAESIRLTLDWYQIFWSSDGSSHDESQMEDTVFSGSWDSGGLSASGAGSIHINDFYELNGRQYAVGSMDTPDGIPALVALVRP